MGDFENIGKFVSVEEGFKHLKDSSKGRLILKKMNIGKFEFDASNTKKFRESLPEGMTGIVLKRKFSKEENETYYSEYIYSVWLNCVKEENQTKIDYNPAVPFSMRKIDWEGNEVKIKKNSLISITSTPVFLLRDYESKDENEKQDANKVENKGTSGFVVFLEVVGIIILICIIIIVGLYCYKKFVQKKNVPIDKTFFYSLIP